MDKYKQTDAEKLRLSNGFEVTDISLEQVTDDEGRQYWLRQVAVDDESDPVERVRLREICDGYELALHDHPEWGTTHSVEVNGKKELVYDPDNEAAAFLYSGSQSMRDWAANLFPTAKALFPLQRLDMGGMVLPGGTIDRRAVYLFTNTLDGIGLRARARIMSQILSDRSAELEGDQLTCVSIGCGAAVPNIDATVKVADKQGKNIKWDLVDPDSEALEFAHQLADIAGLDPNSFTPHKRHYARAMGIEKESKDFVDVLGLWEYLDDNQCRSMLRGTYQLLKPGGSFIASNMISDRPQRDFNQRAVGWPHLTLRDNNDLVRIAASAGVDTNLMTITQSEDHVYAVMEIRKPWS